MAMYELKAEQLQLVTGGADGWIGTGRAGDGVIHPGRVDGWIGTGRAADGIIWTGKADGWIGTG